MPPNIPEWRKQQLNTRSSNEALRNVHKAVGNPNLPGWQFADFWWGVKEGANPVDVATEMAKDLVIGGVYLKGKKAIGKLSEKEVFKNIRKASSEYADDVIGRVQNKFSNLHGQTVPDATVIITKKTKSQKKKTQAPKPTPKQKYIKPQQTKQKKVHGNPRRKKPR